MITFKKMNPAWKQIWIQALRSGNYEQTYEQLKSIDNLNDNKCSYCCLGVLCELVKPGSILNIAYTEYNNPELMSKFHVEWEYNTAATLPKKIGEEVELDKDIQEFLAAMNDGNPYNGMHFKDHNFQQIANFIEDNL